MGLEVATLALIAAGTAAAGTLYSGMQQHEAANTNAELARRQGEADKDAAVAQAERIRKATQRQVGEANAALAASGVSIGEGTPVRINEEIYKSGEDDAYSVLLTGTRRQRNASAEASIMRSQGSAALTGSLLSAGATLAAAGSKWKSPAKAPIVDRSTFATG